MVVFSWLSCSELEIGSVQSTLCTLLPSNQSYPSIRTYTTSLLSHLTTGQRARSADLHPESPPELRAHPVKQTSASPANSYRISIGTGHQTRSHRRRACRAPASKFELWRLRSHIAAHPNQAHSPTVWPGRIDVQILSSVTCKSPIN